MNDNERHQKIINEALVHVETAKPIIQKSPDQPFNCILALCSKLWNVKAILTGHELNEYIKELSDALIQVNFIANNEHEDEKYLSLSYPTSAGEYWREGIKQIIDHSFKKEYQMAYRSLERFCLGQRIDFLTCLES